MTTLSELGAFLQRHREERGWSLDEAEEITHIRRHYIEAMEAGDWDNLPPAVYTRGLLRNYARALGVSQASIMRMHAKERPHEARLPEPQLDLAAARGHVEVQLRADRGDRPAADLGGADRLGRAARSCQALMQSAQTVGRLAIGWPWRRRCPTETPYAARARRTRRRPRASRDATGGRS